MDKFIKGADITSLNQITRLKGKFFTEEGKEKDLLSILKDNDFNSVRLRLFVDPFDGKGRPYGGGDASLSDILALAGRAKEKGFSLLLDLHYSDFWADPGKQFKPKKWADLHGEALIGQVKEYTAYVLHEFAKHKIKTDYIQIGNEITNGMLWPDGQLTDSGDGSSRHNYRYLAELLSAASSVIRKVSPATKIILHLERSYDSALYEEWLDNIYIKHSVDFDILGMSYYPYWHRDFASLEKNIDLIISKYRLPVIIIETSYAFTDINRKNTRLVLSNENKHELPYVPPYPLTQEGQAQFMTDLLALLKNRDLTGFYYWEPAWLPLEGSSWATEEGIKYIKENKQPGNEWANQGLFDYEGKPLPALRIIKEFKKEK